MVKEFEKNSGKDSRSILCMLVKSNQIAEVGMMIGFKAINPTLNLVSILSASATLGGGCGISWASTFGITE